MKRKILTRCNVGEICLSGLILKPYHSIFLFAAVEENGKPLIARHYNHQGSIGWNTTKVFGNHYHILLRIIIG